MTGYKSAYFRWCCDDKGCYYEQLPDWGDLIECFPGNIRPTDVDGMVERNGHVLFLEEKSPGVPLHEGQRRALLALSRLPRITTLFFRPAVRSELECLIFSNDAPLLPDWKPYDGWQPHARRDLLAWLREWARLASAT